MSDKQWLDCRGLPCPQPVIAAKKMLEGGGGDFIMLVDNEAARENVSKFVISQGYTVQVDAEGATFRLQISVPPSSTAQPKGKAVKLDANAAGLRYLLTQDTLGQGAAELGAILMKSFLYALREKNPLPLTIVLLNGGVKIACAESPVLEHLQELSRLGVEILVCGTCLDYYGLKEQLAVGSVTNMYTIVDLMAAGPLVTL